MKGYLKKKEVQRALEEARRLEQDPGVPAEEIARTFEEDLAKTAEIQKALRPSWFIKDLDAPKRKTRRK